MANVRFGLAGVFQQAHLQHLLAEVPLVDLPFLGIALAAGGLVEELDLSETELAREQLEGDGVVAKFLEEPVDGVGEDGLVVKGQLETPGLLNGLPVCGVGVGASARLMVNSANQCEEGDRDHMVPPVVAARVAVGVELLEMSVSDAGFLFEFAAGGGFEVLLLGTDKTARQRVTEGLFAPFDQQHVQPVVDVPAENRAVDCH